MRTFEGRLAQPNHLVWQRGCVTLTVLWPSSFGLRAHEMPIGRKQSVAGIDWTCQSDWSETPPVPNEGESAVKLQTTWLLLAVPGSIRQWTLTTLREELIKIGAKVTRHSKYVTFQLAEVAVTRNLFAAILDRVARLAMPPPLMARARA